MTPDPAAAPHSHVFGTDVYRTGERRTRWVIGITAGMMVAEIAGGMAFGSMALLADGWHMATHAAALGIAAFAYAHARRRSGDPRYSFGTGKVGALGGFGSAVSLAVVAVLVLAESVGRLAAPVAIHFNQAIAVAVVGLAVNLLSALLLRDDDPHHDHHDHDHQGDDDHHHHHHGHDHNLRGAYLHVLADAFTSILAISALFAGKMLGWMWMDAITGILGAIVIARWSLGLLRDTGRVLLDAEVPAGRRSAIQAAIETGSDDRVTDLHVWRVGPAHLAVIVAVSTADPRQPAHYKSRLAAFHDLAHVTVEVNRTEAPAVSTG